MIIIIIYECGSFLGKDDGRMRKKELAGLVALGLMVGGNLCGMNSLSGVVEAAEADATQTIRLKDSYVRPDYKKRAISA